MRTTLAQPAQASPITTFDWWQRFQDITANRTQTAVIPHALNEGDVALLSGEIMHVIRELCRLRTNKYGFRIFLGEELAEDDFLQYVFDNPPADHEPVEAYADRVFREKKFGMIINGCEKFSDPLSKKLLECIYPLLEMVGIPLSGLSVHTFVGNYGYTPLGIHKDNPGENVIHFHLGPGSKIMYNWSDEVYNRHVKGKKQNNKHYEAMIPHAETYAFGTGDIYFMPWNKYHLGKTDGLSIGVTLWFNNPPRRSLFDKIFSSLTKQYLKDDDSVKAIVEPAKDPYSQETLELIKGLLEPDEDLYSLPFGEVIRLLHDDYKLALFSNAGWKTRTISLSDEQLFSLDDYAFLSGKTIQAVHPFRIYSRMSVSREELVIFARGSKLKVKHHPGLDAMLSVLNTGIPVPANQLILPLSADWPEEAGLYILALLYDKRAIELA